MTTARMAKAVKAALRRGTHRVAEDGAPPGYRSIRISVYAVLLVSNSNVNSRHTNAILLLPLMPRQNMPVLFYPRFPMAPAVTHPFLH
jgi:hypothetical protein